MSLLATTIRSTRVAPGSLAIHWLGQCGFVYQTPGGSLIYTDTYLTDSLGKMGGYRRVKESPLAPEEIEHGLLAATHNHPDHIDVEAVPVWLRNPGLRFAGSADCGDKWDELGVPRERYIILHWGQSLRYGDATLTGVYADHGESAPEALGFLLTVGNIRLFQVGDGLYHPERWQEVIGPGIDVLVTPINAQGNLTKEEAAQLAALSRARVVIPCHIGIFAEQMGDVPGFLADCARLAPRCTPHPMQLGETFTYTPST